MVNINLKLGRILVEQPFVDTHTPSGMIKLEKQLKQERDDAAVKPHKVLAMADDVERLKLGDLVYLSPQAHVEHIIVEGKIYVAYSQSDIVGTVKDVDAYLAWVADEEAKKQEKQKEILSKHKSISIVK